MRLLQSQNCNWRTLVLWAASHSPWPLCFRSPYVWILAQQNAGHRLDLLASMATVSVRRYYHFFSMRSYSFASSSPENHLVCVHGSVKQVYNKKCFKCYECLHLVVCLYAAAEISYRPFETAHDLTFATENLHDGSLWTWSVLNRHQCAGRRWLNVKIAVWSFGSWRTSHGKTSALNTS